VWNKKNPKLSFAEGELAWVRSGNLLRIFDWYSARVEGGGKIHPTQKPVKLYEWLLDNYAEEGQTILDTHLGSGSIALACHNRGYSLTAFEIDKEYFDAAKKRLKTHQQQLTMF
jgi:site-specific DNA-methyltransferase (adenine-specific)